MTEGTSRQPGGPGQAPAEIGSPEPTTSDQDGNVANPDQPSAQAQEPAKSRRGRSNEFWLALAGIAATVAVGVTGSLLTYGMSTQQMKAESDRAALSFTREERKVAYADWLSAQANMDMAELKINRLFEGKPASSVDLKELENRYNDYIDARDQTNRAGSTVRLLASHDVAEVWKAVTIKHARNSDVIDELMTDARRGDLSDVTDLLYKLGSTLNASINQEQQFIDAAKSDLGLAD